MVPLKYFAVVGVGRSGTTLLMAMLNAHPLIAMPPESHFVSRHLVKHPRAEMEELVRRLHADDHFGRLGLDIVELMEPFRSGRKQYSVAQVYSSILEHWATRHKVRIVGDKAPKNVEYLPILHHLFPDGQIIHLIRDPRDVYLSRLQAEWSSSRPEWHQFVAYRTQVALGRRWGRRLFGGNYMEVYYEALISQPKTELERVCDFLGISFTSSMLEFAESGRELVFPDEISWKKEVLGPLLSNNAGKWREVLSPQNVLRVEAGCSPSFRAGVYSSVGINGSLKSILCTWLVDIRISILAALYRLHVMWTNRGVLKALGQQKEQDVASTQARM